MNTDEILKLFAMSNLMLENDLANIEKSHEFDLRGRQDAKSDRDEKYYPQFDHDIRTEAASMAHHYETFYCLEKSIRILIAERLEEAKGGKWWEVCVPDSIREDVEKNIEREVDAAVSLRSTENIDYTTFGQLSNIILSNWDLFGDTFNSRKGLQKVLANLNVLRGPIAHCSPLAPREVTRLQITLEDWFTLMQ